MTLLEQFENYLRYEKQLADLSITAYRRDLSQFEAYLEDDILTTSHTDIRSFVVSQVEKGAAPKSINRRIASLHAFFKFALLKQLLEKDPSELVQNVKQPKKIPNFITEKQLDRIVNSVETIDYDQILNFTIVYTLYATGLRRSELENLTLGDLNMSQGTIIVTGKGNKTRIVPLSQELQNILKQYEQAKKRFNIDQSGDNICTTEKKSLFLTRKNKPITDDQIYAIIKKTVKQFGLSPDCSPHTLRHTFATHLLNQNVPLRSIQELLGHANLNTTQIYTHTSTEELKKTFITAHPRGKKSNL